VPLLMCPDCHCALRLGQQTRADDGDIESGDLVCPTGHVFPIENSIPRFVPRTNYADSFSLQWRTFARTQLEPETFAPISRTRFLEETNWSGDLTGERILEIGSGAGRFTGHAARTGAIVISVDYSDAIDVARRNNQSLPNIHYLQADLRRLPVRNQLFDKVYCFGVLQHTPDPRSSFQSLLPPLRSGGEVVFDIYRLSWKTIFSGKYYLRIVTTRIPAGRLLGIVVAYVNALYAPIGLLHHLSSRLARVVATFLGIADYRGVYVIPSNQLFEMTILDTFDGLSPAHDHPQTLGRVRSWLSTAGLIDADARPGYNGIVARGKVP
jgi:SAM-dependent methyltransferase